MSVLPNRNIWIRSRVPQQLPCPACGRSSKFVAYQQPENYEYRCSTCGSTSQLTLSQINAMESNRFHRVPSVLIDTVLSKTGHPLKG